MKNGLIIADSGPIISLALVDQLALLESLFDDIKVPQAVWSELTIDDAKPFYEKIHAFFKDKVHQVKGPNDLMFVMDYGESESVILYQEMQADFLLIDDKKARTIAKALGINCIGTLGILLIAKDKGYIDSLRPIFEKFLANKRYYAVSLLNTLLEERGEDRI